jgi:hypothetical protein
MAPFSRRKVLIGMVSAAGMAATAFAADAPDTEALRAEYRKWIESLPKAPEPALAKDHPKAIEMARWHVLEANQGVAVDAQYFYGIGNHALVKHRKDTGERVAEWFGPNGGAIIHINSGWVDGDKLVTSHSNFSQLPMASSLEIFDTKTLQPVSSYSFGIRLGSLTWAVRRDGYWWACFANYNDDGTTPGFDQRWTFFAQFDDNWQQLQSWLFPPQVIATWQDSSCSGGDWGDDGLLYVTGHDEPLLHVLRLPKQGVALEYVTTIDVPFEGQSWAWDRSTKDRVIYGISRARQEVIVARIPEVSTR